MTTVLREGVKWTQRRAYSGDSFQKELGRCTDVGEIGKRTVTKKTPRVVTGCNIRHKNKDNKQGCDRKNGVLPVLEPYKIRG